MSQTTYFHDMKVYVRRGFRKWSRQTSKIVFATSGTFLAVNFWNAGPNPVGPRVAQKLLSFVRFGPNPAAFFIVLTATGAFALSFRQQQNPSGRKQFISADGWRYARDTSAASIGVGSTYLIKQFFVGGPVPPGRTIARLLLSFLRFGPNPYYIAIMSLSAGVFLFITLTESEEGELLQLKSA